MSNDEWSVGPDSSPVAPSAEERHVPLVIRVACAQLAARTIQESERALAEALEAIEEAARTGADLVVLPECTYPAYVLAPVDPRPRLRPDEEIRQVFAAAAASHKISVAVGLAERYGGRGRTARNVALLFDRHGNERLRVAKQFLWDFDQSWFAPGSPIEPTAALGGSIGMLVCADARMPEIARGLSLHGARLILDPTAWVTTGRDPDRLSNPQPEFLMSIRALENGTWIAAADKVGVERDAVVYAGRSGIFAPDGSTAAMAGSSEPEVVRADVDLRAATGPPVSRRPDLYRLLTAPIQTTPVYGRIATPVEPHKAVARVAIYQAGELETSEAFERRTASEHGLHNALGIDLAFGMIATHEGAHNAEPRLSPAPDRAWAVGQVDRRGTVVRLDVLTHAHTLTAMPTHGELVDTTDQLDERTIDLDRIRVGVMVGAEGLVPEVGRVLTLLGAELVLWAADRTSPLALNVARARALENRVYVAVIGVDEAGAALSALLDPDGAVAAIGLRGRDQMVTGYVRVPAARQKLMASGTDVILGRRPETYASLVVVPAEVATGR
jgi:predicted amidohydrolase